MISGQQYCRCPNDESATRDAYYQRYRAAWHLGDVNGFVRYQHFGEGAYQENEEQIQELLAERNESLATRP